MEIRTVDAERGARWFVDGFGFFGKAPLIWVAISFLVLLAVAVLSFVPLLGSIATQVIMSILIGGLMLGCRAQDEGRPLSVDHLFEGFRVGTTQLAIAGLLSFIGWLAIVIIFAVLVIVFLGGLGVFQQLSHPDPSMILGVLASVALPLLVALALSVPLVMFIWFAPALIVFDGKDAIAALRLSFSGCLVNVVPFLVFGLVVLPIVLVGCMPLVLVWMGKLVMALLLMVALFFSFFVLFPLVTISAYLGYKDIYGAAPSVPA